MIQQGKDPKLTVKAIRKLCAWNDDLLIQLLLKAQAKSTAD
jgi:hypothetical protein